MPSRWLSIPLFAILLTTGCCRQFSVEAVPEYACHKKVPKGIPFYLPKPLLIISKNFQYIEESKVGLTDSPPIPNGFDDQAAYGSLNAAASFSRVQSNDPKGDVNITHNHGDVKIEKNDASKSEPKLHSKGAPITPREKDQQLDYSKPVFTYQIVFVPDLTQKHYLRIQGGPGEIRATMNLVNGWMYTGLGPFYLKDSSTAQNILSTGIAANLAASGAADVINSVTDLSKVFAQDSGNQAYGTKYILDALIKLKKMSQPYRLPKDTQMVEAEIHVLEPHVNSMGEMEWREINPTATHFKGCWLGENQTIPVPLGNVQDTKLEAILTSQLPQQLANEDAIRRIKAESAAKAEVEMRQTAMQAILRPADAAETEAVIRGSIPPVKKKWNWPILNWLGWKCSPTVNQETTGPTTVITP